MLGIGCGPNEEDDGVVGVGVRIQASRLSFGLGDTFNCVALSQDMPRLKEEDGLRGSQKDVVGSVALTGCCGDFGLSASPIGTRMRFTLSRPSSEDDTF